MLTAITVLLNPFTTVQAANRSAQPGAPSAYDLIAAVNALRAANGLNQLNADPYLMASAQGHSDYQASIGTWTHEGAGGSTYTSRAIAAGYGGGSTVYVRENVAMITGTGTTDYIVYTLWADAIHWNTMLNPSVRDIGIGMSQSGNWYFYTMDVGYTGNSPAPTSTRSSASGTQPVTQATALPIMAVQTVTPATDGSIIHTVQSGQTLYTIAAAYGTTPEEIRKLNGMTNSTIYIGQTLIISAAYTPTPSPTITNTPIPPTATPTNSPTPRKPTATRAPTHTRTPTPEPSFLDFSVMDSGKRQTIGIVMIAICSLGLAGLVFSLFRKK